MGRSQARLRSLGWLVPVCSACANGIGGGGGSGGATLGAAETDATDHGGATAWGDTGGSGVDDDGPGASSIPGDGSDDGGGEICNGLDDDGDGMVDEDLAELACGVGACATTVVACVGGVPNQCFPTAAHDEQCNGLDDDCDGSTDEDLVQACDTACGPGTQACVSGGWGGCDAPPPQAESCNIVDDDCNGQVDDGLAGCRVDVTRWWHPTTGEHFYSVDPDEGFCCGYQQEYSPFFRLYAAPQPQTTAFYRCLSSGGFHHYTTDAGCEGLPVNEGVMGYIGTMALPGSTALYRSYNAGNGDHFFTNSAAEHAYAVDSLGFVDEGVVGYVW